MARLSPVMRGEVLLYGSPAMISGWFVSLATDCGPSVAQHAITMLRDLDKARVWTPSGLGALHFEHDLVAAQRARGEGIVVVGIDRLANRAQLA